jgi:hypothetical protein
MVLQEIRGDRRRDRAEKRRATDGQFQVTNSWQSEDPLMAGLNFQVTDESTRDAKQMAGLGFPEDDIAKFLGISEARLRRLFRTELCRGPIEANRQVMQALFDTARSGKNAMATMFWAKTRCGMQEKNPGEMVAEPPVTTIVFREEAADPNKNDHETEQ